MKPYNKALTSKNLDALLPYMEAWMEYTEAAFNAPTNANWITLISGQFGNIAANVRTIEPKELRGRLLSLAALIVVAVPELFGGRMMHAQVAQRIALERLEQHSKWGEQNHAPDLWLLVLAEEYGEAMKEANEFIFRNAPCSLGNLRTELIQVAAVCLAFVESLDRNELGGRANG